MTMTVKPNCPDTGEIDLHGLHPYDDDIYSVIEAGMCQAHEAGLSHLVIIHGHGKNRASYRPQFVNSNTGYLGQAVRGLLRHRGDLRQYMFAKFSCSHDGSTKVRIRPNLAKLSGNFAPNYEAGSPSHRGA